ncbi:MAG: hypothetical protein K2Y14_09420 [Burkholderiales bacterium]|nr:hypothetical protein [Burkholderiales bacterium]
MKLQNREFSIFEIESNNTHTDLAIVASLYSDNDEYLSIFFKQVSKKNKDDSTSKSFWTYPKYYNNKFMCYKIYSQTRKEENKKAIIDTYYMLLVP